MESCRVILSNESQLLRGLLSRALRRAPGVEVVGEEVDPSRLPAAVEKNGAQWLVVSLPRDGKLPGFLRTLLDGHPSLCLLAVAGDASWAKIWCPSMGERVLDHVSLDDLVNVMHQTGGQPDERSGKPEVTGERSI